MTTLYLSMNAERGGLLQYLVSTFSFYAGTLFFGTPCLLGVYTILEIHACSNPSPLFPNIVST